MRIDMSQWIKMGCPAINIKYNGIIHPHCVFADEEKGIVIDASPDNWLKGMDDIPERVLKGQVQIILGDNVR